MEIIAGMADMGAAMAAGDVKVEGDAGALIELFGLLDEPDYNYDIVTP